MFPFSLRRRQSSLAFDLRRFRVPRAVSHRLVHALPYLFVCFFPVLCLKSCQPNPCQHGARCVENTPTSVKCICLPGWKGQYRKKQTMPHDYCIILLLLLSCMSSTFSRGLIFTLSLFNKLFLLFSKPTIEICTSVNQIKQLENKRLKTYSINKNTFIK